MTSMMKTSKHLRKRTEVLKSRRDPHAHRLEELTLWEQLYYQSNLKTQCDLHQNSNFVSHRNRKKNPKIDVQAQKTPEARTILSKGTTLKVLQCKIPSCTIDKYSSIRTPDIETNGTEERTQS